MTYEETIERLSLCTWGICLEEADENKNYHQANDLLWKGVLEDIFDDFLRFFFPDAAEYFDLDRGFEYLDKALEQLFPPENNQYMPRHADKLIKVYTRKGKEEWILLHVEIQGYYQKSFPARMFRYYSRILDKYERPITAFAIFTDDNKSFRPDRFEHSCRGTSLRYIFNTYKILEQDEAQLAASDNPFAVAVLVVKTALAGKHLEDEQLYPLKIQLMKRLLSKRIPKKKVESMMIFLEHYIRFENKEMNVKFEQDKDYIIGRKNTMGIKELLLDITRREGLEQGIEKGRMEGKEQFVKNLILKLGLSDEQVAGVAEVSIEFAREIRRRVRGFNLE